jgi:hypothetical protein
MAIGKAAIHGAAFLALFVLGCSATGDANLERSAEPSLDLVMTYHEETSLLYIDVTIGRFAQHVQKAVDLRIDVRSPDGTMKRHQLGWTRGDGPVIPRVELPATDSGLYEVVLSKVSIDGEKVGGPPVYRSMELLGERGNNEMAGDCGPGELIQGTPGPDWLVGTAGQDAMYGYDGRDALYGEECGDVIRGGHGNDDIWGGKGNDTLLGGDGFDVCKGGPGWDTFQGCEQALQGGV